MYSKPIQGSALISFLKIFKTDFENYEPYTPINGGEDTEEDMKKKYEELKKEGEETEEEESTSADEE